MLAADTGKKTTTTARLFFSEEYKFQKLVKKDLILDPIRVPRSNDVEGFCASRCPVSFTASPRICHAEIAKKHQWAPKKERE